MQKANVEELKKLNYQDGVNLLTELGYVQNDTGITEEVPSCDYIIDTYFILFDEDDEELHKVSYSQYMNKNNEPSNDDGNSDFVVKEEWQEV